MRDYTVKYRRTYRLFSLLIAAFFFFDAANVDDLIPGIDSVHVDEVLILMIIDNGHDLHSDASAGSLPQHIEFKTGVRPGRSHTDLDSPVTLTSSYRKEGAGSIIPIPKPPKPPLQEADHTLFLELCCLQI
jgi:hypothetical protein